MVKAPCIAVALELCGLAGVAAAQTGSRARVGEQQHREHGVAAARREVLRELLPRLPLREVRALQPARRRICSSREQQLVDNLMFTGERPFDTMAIAMQPEDCDALVRHAAARISSLIARSRGTDYLYTFLRSFYADPSTADGRRTTSCCRGTAMPHVLWELQGTQRAVFTSERPRRRRSSMGSRCMRPGELPPSEFDEVVRDIVNFLDYIGEPIKRERAAARHPRDRVLARVPADCLSCLKKEIWKDVH